ncbi:MAG: response regulator transcription factor, partial [Cyanobacteria bacterium]|nr:response regulator transcription factor [Cyanobacteriota bacterium]
SKAILTAWPTAKIVILTNQDDGEVLKKLMDLDIKGYFLKDIQADELVERLYQVMAGERIGLSPDLEQKMKLAKSTAAASSHFSLTEREREVLIALSKGYSNQQLADLLTVSPKTVHNHLYNIYSKIGVSSRSEAIVWAIQANLEGQGPSSRSF